MKNRKNTETAKNRLLHLVYGDVTLGVHGNGFDYLFSYQAGGPESFRQGEIEWLYRAPAPTYWRASTDNDRGSGFPKKSAMWMGADQFPDCKSVKVKVDGKAEKHFLAPANNCHNAHEYASSICITYVYETATVPKTKTKVSYTVDAAGGILVKVHYYGKKGLPQLPVLGLRLVMPALCAGYSYDGLSGETYPDRCAGGIKGHYDVPGLPVTPYLVPQECGMHVQTTALTVWQETKQKGIYAGFQVEAAGDAPFSFSCLPYTAQELESAYHQEELPLPRRTVLCILGAVRGVGGIDSWGTDVMKEYQISAESDIRFQFCMKPLPERRTEKLSM